MKYEVNREEKAVAFTGVGFFPLFLFKYTGKGQLTLLETRMSSYGIERAEKLYNFFNCFLLKNV